MEDSLAVPARNSHALRPQPSVRSSLVVRPEVVADEGAEFVGCAPILLEHRRAPAGMPAPRRRMQAVSFQEFLDERFTELLRSAAVMSFGSCLKSPLRHEHGSNGLQIVQ